MKNNRPNNLSKWIEQESKFQGKYSKNVFETLWFSYFPHRWQIFGLIIAGFLGRISLLSNANMIGYWVDSFCDPSKQRCLPLPAVFQGWDSNHFIALLGIMTLVGFIFTAIFRITFSRISAQAVSQIYDEVTYRASRFPMSFFDRTPIGRIITRFSSDYGNVFRMFGGPLAEFFSILFDLTSMLILITVASPFYLVIVFFVAILNFIVYRLNRDRLRESRRFLSATRSPSIAHFAETAQGASTIRTFSKQLSFSWRFKNLDQFFLTQKLKTTRLLVLYSFQMNTLTAVLFLITGVFAYHLLNRGLLSVGSIGVAFSFIALSGNTVQMFFEWMTQFEEAMVGVERLDQYLRRPLEPNAKIPNQATFKTGHPRYSSQMDLEKLKKETSPTAEIEFHNVWLKYEETANAVLKGINFKVNVGEKLGIIGRTGSGKSSMIQALFQFYPLEQGRISINGKSPSGKEEHFIDLLKYRAQMAYISQDPILFKGTVRENLARGGAGDDQEMIEALKIVGLRNFADPQNLDFMLEERGRNISVGERQLLCMARCLLQKAPIIILDEATSSVDPYTEELLVRATDEFFKGKTQIIIAHRLSTLEKCDRLLWLQNGVVKKMGTPDEILPEFKQSDLTI